MPFLGDILPLSVQTLDENEVVFITAELKDPDGVALSQSPVSMDNIGGGKYTSDSVLMPNKSYVECTYKAFDDAAHTIESDDHLVGTDVFDLVTPPPVNVSVLDRIEARIVQDKLKGCIVDPQILAVIKEQRLQAWLAQPKIQGCLKMNQKIFAVIRECS